MINKIPRYHKVAFTGLMNNEKSGEWCKWKDVENLIWDYRCEETEMSEEFLKRKACYRNCYITKLKVSLLVNLLFLVMIFGV